MKVLIRNGKGCFENAIEATDVLVENGKVAALGSFPDASPSAKVIDAKGLFVLPGFIDIHTHLDDASGRFYLADTYQTGARVAVQNGVATIFTFITQGWNERLSESIANAPAKTFRIYPQKGAIRVGSDADLSIVDLHRKPEPIRSTLSDAYETYPDRKSTLDFKYVLVRGEVIVSHNQLSGGNPPGGVCLCRN